MEKLSSCVFLLVAIFLVQNVALAVWPTLSFCGRDEPSEDRDSNNTVNLTMDDENYCIPTDIPKLNAKSTYYLRSRERFYVNISGVFGGSGAVEVEAVQQQADVGVLRNSCILAEDDKYFVKFFIDEDAVIAPENRLFYLNIGTVERRFLFQFYPTGLNLADQRPLQTTYTVDELPLPILSVLVLSEDNKTVSIFDYKVCKVEGNTYTLIEGSLVFDTTSLEGICNTFDLDEGLLRAGNLKLSPKGDLVDLLFEDSPSIRIVAVPGNCNDSELQDSAQVITIARFATTSSTTMQTPTPTSGGTDSTNTPTGNGGLSAGAIAGIVIASTIIGVGFLVAVILAAVILVLKRPEWFKTIRRPPTETVLSHVSPSDPEAAVEQPKDTTEEIGEHIHVPRVSLPE
ncbi:hypothetical protein GBAR_LOCUS7759 [Geodia barretti]|uniref:Uncharacterized protein n=1 Tax=Geodia barretti TaxID=519541 RepID=A0AA35RJX0_GEOBA|nr:hypothetical protein GBAR_LOCUS7759 [Geodia barretti]